jgi:hypothetical protein
LPDISKLNAVAIGDIEKVDALATSSISKVDGITLPVGSINPDAATSGFLFTYPNAGGAYSVRQLNNNANTALMVRRASDDATANIGFDGSGDLAVADIASHCGTSDGFVEYWYDQTGLQNHAEQADAAYQPKIYDGTTQSVLEEGSTGNEKPTLKFLWSGSGPLPTLGFTSLDVQGAFTVCRPETLNVGSANCVIGQANLVGLAAAGESGGRTARAFTNSGTLNITALGALTDQCFLAFNSDGTNGSLEYNGANEVTGGAQAMTVDAIGATRVGSVNTLRLQGNAQEIILYETDQTSNRTGIETSVNGYFNIF